MIFMSKWIEKYLTTDDINKISEHVANAEKQTDGEIVPIIVQRSSSIGHVKWLLTLVMTILFLAVQNEFIPYHKYNFLIPPLAVMIFYGLSLILENIVWVQRVLTPAKDEIDQVNARAELEFYRKQIRNTHRRTGILIFVSFMEKRVVILADEGIAKHYPAETWNQVAALLTHEFKKGNIRQGLENAISKCGEILRAKLPITVTDSNELPNHLIIKT